MKKLGLNLFALFAILGLTASIASAQSSETFTVQAEILPSNGATFSVSKVTPGNPDQFQSVNTTDLDFGVLTLNTNLGIFLPSFFWVIDVAPNGAGNPDIDIEYLDTGAPAGAIATLGQRGTISFAEVIPQPNNQPDQVNVIKGESLAEADGDSIDETQFAAGFARISVSTATGDPNLQEGTAQPFTALDKDGVYNGQLKITTTFD